LVSLMGVILEIFSELLVQHEWLKWQIQFFSSFVFLFFFPL
jgi:hypothetical protein